MSNVTRSTIAAAFGAIGTVCALVALLTMIGELLLVAVGCFVVAAVAIP